MGVGCVFLWLVHIFEFCSFEFHSWNVVHRQVVHVGLHELECLVFNHLDSLGVKLVAPLLDLIAAESLALILGLVKRLPDDLLDIRQSLDALSHAQAEVSEPFVIEGNGPVLTQELNSVRNDTIGVALRQLVQVVFMEANEAP